MHTYGVWPLAGLPRRVRIHEVGPRDGLQNEARSVSTESKVAFIDRLGDAGLTVIEATSFVRRDRIPQLSDAQEVMQRIDRRSGVSYPVLVPNLVGLQRALEVDVTDVAVFASATESFARKNLGRGLDESLRMFAPVVEQARTERLGVRGYVSMCFGDPWEGAVKPSQVLAVTRALYEMGCDEISLGDTIGVATPGQVESLVGTLIDAGTPLASLAVHFHDTYGQALVNTLTALRLGITTIDSSAGGLGGCPFAVSATGNLATEDLVWMLHGLGIETGVDLSSLVDTSRWMAEQLGRPSPSSVVQAWQ